MKPQQILRKKIHKQSVYYKVVWEDGSMTYESLENFTPALLGLLTAFEIKRKEIEKKKSINNYPEYSIPKHQRLQPLRPQEITYQPPQTLSIKPQPSKHFLQPNSQEQLQPLVQEQFENLTQQYQRIQNELHQPENKIHLQNQAQQEHMDQHNHYLEKRKHRLDKLPKISQAPIVEKRRIAEIDVSPSRAQSSFRKTNQKHIGNRIKPFKNLAFSTIQETNQQSKPEMVEQPYPLINIFEKKKVYLTNVEKIKPASSTKQNIQKKIQKQSNYRYKAIRLFQGNRVQALVRVLPSSEERWLDADWLIQNQAYSFCDYLLKNIQRD